MFLEFLKMISHQGFHVECNYKYKVHSLQKVSEIFLSRQWGSDDQLAQMEKFIQIVYTLYIKVIQLVFLGLK